jgi:hypothetical protein
MFKSTKSVFRNYFWIILWFSLILFFVSCDTSNDTVVDVINSSSHDLHIIFIKSKDAFSSANIEMDLRKGETGIFHLLIHLGPDSPLDPNRQIEKIVFLNLDTEEIIKELKNNKLFVFLYSSGSPKTDYYKLEITDDLF